MAEEDSCVSCPICMETYSDTRYPIVGPNCGHSICIDCGNKRKSNVCVSCTVGSFRYSKGFKQPWPCNEWNKNVSLLDTVKLVNQFKTKYGLLTPDGIDYLECSSCKSMEKSDRMGICGTCAEDWNKEWKGMKEEELVHLFLCGLCCLKNHFGHVFVDLLPWKVNSLLTSTVTDGQSAVSSMNEICFYEVEKGKEQLEKWNEKLASFGTLRGKTYHVGLSIAKTIKLECDLVTRYSEDCLPPLRKYRKVVTDSTSRLELLRNEVDNGIVRVGESKAAKEKVVSDDQMETISDRIVSPNRSGIEVNTASEDTVVKVTVPSQQVVKKTRKQQMLENKAKWDEETVRLGGPLRRYEEAADMWNRIPRHVYESDSSCSTVSEHQPDEESEKSVPASSVRFGENVKKRSRTGE